MASENASGFTFSFDLDAAKKGYHSFIATRQPARCPYDSKLFRSIITRHFQAEEALPQQSRRQLQQQQLRQASSIGKAGRRRSQATPSERLSGGSDVSNSQAGLNSLRRESWSRSAMLVQRSLRELQRQQSLSQQMHLQRQPSTASNPVSRRESTLSLAAAPPKSPCFTSQDQLLNQLRRLFNERCSKRQQAVDVVEEPASVQFVVGSSPPPLPPPSGTSKTYATGGETLPDVARSIADCLLGLPLPPAEMSLSEISNENKKIVKRSTELIKFAIDCLDQVGLEPVDDDEKWTVSQLKVFGLLMLLDQAGFGDEIETDDHETLVKWSFNQLRSHLFFPDGRVCSFLAGQLASVWPHRGGAGLARLVRDIRQEMALPVSDAEEDSEPEDDENRLLDASRDVAGSGSGLLDATIEDANSEFPDLSTAPAIPAFYCGVEAPILCDGRGGVGGGGGGGYDRLLGGRSSLPRCASSSVLRGMTNQRQLFVPAATVSATSVVGSHRLASSASFHQQSSSAKAKETPTKNRKSSSKRRSRIRVLETPTPKRSRLRLQRLASERTRDCPIVIAESPPGSPTNLSDRPSASLLLLRQATGGDFGDKESTEADKENHRPKVGCRAVALADAWVQRQREREAELTRFDVADYEGTSQQSSTTISSSGACRRISFQPDGGSSGSSLVRRASQLFANLVSP